MKEFILKIEYIGCPGHINNKKTKDNSYEGIEFSAAHGIRGDRHSADQCSSALPEYFCICGIEYVDAFDSRKPWNQRAGAALRNCGLRNFVNILQWTNPEKTAILYLRSFKKFLNLADAGIGAARICGLTQTIIPVWT